jgi:hypothetical protein
VLHAQLFHMTLPQLPAGTNATAAQNAIRDVFTTGIFLSRCV